MPDLGANPLCSRAERIAFGNVTPEHVASAIEHGVAEADEAFGALLEQPGRRSYANTVEPLDALLERVSRVYGYARHLTNVRSTPELRVAFARVEPLYKGFCSRVAAHPGLYRALRAVAESAEAGRLDPLRARHLEKSLRELRRSGAALPEAERERVTALRVELAGLATSFGENLLDATQAYHLDLDEEAGLEGLPSGSVARAREAARLAGLPGWRFTLQAPSYLPFMRHARRRDLREALWRAYNDRAFGGPFDNRPLVERTLAARRELASLLGYRDYAALTLEDRMVGGVGPARDFLGTLAARTRPYFERETQELRSFAHEELGLEAFAPWDVRFAFERLRERRYALDEEALRPYFPLPRVEQGLFDLAGDLFGLRFAEVAAPERWHPDVRCFEVHDERGTHVGTFYTDWYPRSDKRDGAWMHDLITGGPREDGGFDPHVGVVCGNLTPGEGGAPALLDFAEVQTLFHEFGHLLHQLLTRVPVRARGQGAVAWDFIELPSQLLENWTYQRSALIRFARRADGEPIPDEEVEKLLEARHFMEPWAQMRQLSFAELDMALHVDFDPAAHGDVFEYARSVMAPFEVQPDFVPPGFLCGFAHIMAGGYAAGYYAYKWSEMLDADAFTRFTPGNLFDRAVGRELVDTILSRGDAADAAELFADFMGRGPRLDALIERNLGPAPEAPDASAAPAG